MKMRYTPENIEKLAKGEIFVFGSNLSGYHVGGAAKIAVEYFGAMYGRAEGLQGQSYAIPTEVPSLAELRHYVNNFIRFAKKNQSKTFLVTKIGCGEAGFETYDVALLFLEALELDNVVLPEIFVEILKTQPRYLGFPMNTWDSHVNYLDKKKALEKSILSKSTDLKQLNIDVFFNTVQIVNSEFYITESGEKVKFLSSWKMDRNTVLYSEKISVKNVPSLNRETEITIAERDCLKAAVDLKQEGYNPAVLNMANGNHPGGGVLKGSRAQEESIFRRTNLFKSLYRFAPYASKFDVKEADQHYPLDDNYGGVYSPYVVYFRDSEKYGCRLLETPQYVSVISVAAVEKPELAGKESISDKYIDTIKNKIRTIYRIGLRHRHDSLVLGAWGCGAFCNPPRHIAQLFHTVLMEKEFKNKFRKIVFAIIDDHNSRKSHNPEGNVIPFIREFKVTNSPTMKNHDFNLVRFIEAQEDTYHRALKELQEGKKSSHWIWYIFPQLKHLGGSTNSLYYGISGLEEATAYLDNPILSRRLREVCSAILILPTDDAKEVFGKIDCHKLRSSMTLFDQVAPNDVFARVLDKYFNSQRDQVTIDIIKN